MKTSSILAILFLWQSLFAQQKFIVLTAFGTSHKDALKSYDLIEEDFRQNFPEYQIEWAYTSSFIRKKLRQKNIILHAPKEKLEELKLRGAKEIVVQSLHIFSGAEFGDLKNTVADFQKKNPAFKIALGLPLFTKESLQRNDFIENLYHGITEKKKPDELFIYMAHGNDKGDGDELIKTLAQQLQKKDSTVFLAGVEGKRKITEILTQIRSTSPRKVHIAPLMLVAGEHAKNDLAGEDSNSWQSLLEKSHFEVKSWLIGLGEEKKVRKLFVKRTEEALHHE